MASPNFFIDQPYAAKQHCIFNLPSCPEGTLTYFQWDMGNFVLQPPCTITFDDGFQLRLCIDHIQFPDLGLGSFNLNTDDSGLFCGDQPGFSLRFSSRPLTVDFRTGQSTGEFRGFLIDVMCTEPTFQTQTSSDSLGRFRRDVDKDVHIQMRGKRLAIPRPTLTSENCTILSKSPPPTTTRPPTVVSQWCKAYKANQKAEVANICMILRFY